jgi:hypothetical protein
MSKPDEQRCANCCEPIIQTGAYEYVHKYELDPDCHTGDGSTAYPQE